MKVFVSYVIQNPEGHKHMSEIVDINEPTISYSSDTPITHVLEWAKEKMNLLVKGQELIIVNIFKM